MDELERLTFGRDDPQEAPSILDWKAYYMDILVPLYHHQPLIARKVAPVKKIGFDGKRSAEIGVDYDIEDPAIAMEPLEKDTAISGDVETIKLPQMALTCLLSDDLKATPFMLRDRLGRWNTKAVRKIAQWEDIIGFQGVAALGIQGLAGTNSKTITKTGPWGLDTGSNGVLDNAKADLTQHIDYYTNLGMGDRPLKLVLTSYAYNLLRSTEILYAHKTNLDLWKSMLPEGSKIYYTNNLQTAVASDANTLLSMIALAEEEDGAYSLFGSGIEQKVKQEGLWSWRYGLREKWSVNVVDDDYVAKTTAIDIAAT
ncbi:MAG: hypothetical protein ACTSPK_00140 [Candidatus Heimdallarchaeota archaeon]